MATGAPVAAAVTLGPSSKMASSSGVTGTEDVGTGAEADVPDADLSFKEHMWDRFDLVWTQLSEPTRRLLDDLVACLRDRAQLERAYAKGLARNVLRLTPHLEGDHVSPEVECIMANMKNRAEQTMELADELEADVASTIDIMLKQHAEVSKRMVADGQRLSKNYGDAKRVHQSVASRYVQACVDAEITAKDCISGVLLRPADRTKIGTRAVTLARQATAAERDYRKAVQRLGAASELQNRQMGLALAALQEVEEKRTLCFRDAAMKIAVYETSFLRNVQYDIDGGVKGLEEIEVFAGLQAFVKANRSPAPPLEVSAQGFWELEPPQIKDASVPGAPLRPGGPSSGKWAHEGEKALSTQLSITRPIVQALLIDCKLVDSDALEELRRGLSGSGAEADASSTASEGSAAGGGCSLSSVCRAAFCAAIREAISSRSGQDLTCVAPEELLPMKLEQLSVFDAVVSLFMAALDGCDREADAWNGRDLMVLTQKVQVWADEKVVDTLVKVYTHPLWSRVTFWEDVLVMGLTEAYAHQAIGRRQQPTSTENTELVTTAFLQRFVGFMAAFGIRLEQAHGCVRRTLKKHAEVLGSTAEAFAELLTRDGGSLAPDPTAAVATGDKVAEPAAALAPDGRGASSPPAVVAMVTPLQLAVDAVKSEPAPAPATVGQGASSPPSVQATANSPQSTADTVGPTRVSELAPAVTAAAAPEAMPAVPVPLEAVVPTTAPPPPPPPPPSSSAQNTPAATLTGARTSAPASFAAASASVSATTPAAAAATPTAATPTNVAAPAAPLGVAAATPTGSIAAPPLGSSSGDDWLDGLLDMPPVGKPVAQKSPSSGTGTGAGGTSATAAPAGDDPFDGLML